MPACCLIAANFTTSGDCCKIPWLLKKSVLVKTLEIRGIQNAFMFERIAYNAS